MGIHPQDLRLTADAFDLGGQPVKNQPVQLHPGTRVIDIDSNEIPEYVVVENYTGRDLTTLDTRPFGKVYVERIGISVLGGMIVGTLIGVFFIPLFFVVIQKVFGGRGRDPEPEPEAIPVGSGSDG